MQLEAHAESGGTLFGGGWGITGENTFSIVLSSSTGSVTASSGGFSLSFGEVSAAATSEHGAFFSSISASNLGGDGGDESNSGEFQLCLEFDLLWVFKAKVFNDSS